MSPSTQKKMRRIEIFTGCALSAIVIKSLHLYLNYWDSESVNSVADGIFFSLPVAFISTLPFFSLLLVSILFIIGKFRSSPARYITGTLFALTFLSNIWQVARKTNWNIPRYLKNYLDSSILCNLIFAAGLALCSLTYFGVIRFRRKGRLTLLTYIFAIFNVISVIVINYKVGVNDFYSIEEIVAISLEPVLLTALCFFPENNSEKEKLNMAGKCGFIFLNLTYISLVINHIVFLIIIPSLPNFQISFSYTFLDYVFIVWNIVTLILFLLGVFLAPMLLANKKFDNDKI